MTGTIADARFMGAVRDAATPRHTLSIPPPQHEGAFEAVAGNYAAQRVLMRYPSVLAGNALCCLLSIAMLVRPLCDAPQARRLHPCCQATRSV